MSTPTPQTYRKFNSFNEFYPYYLGEHANLTNRRLHGLGTFLFLFFLIKNIIFGGSFFDWLLLPIVGYGFAWTGHFFFENNKPATFKHPVWSLMGDFRMMT
jgi:hypothetical protein